MRALQHMGVDYHLLARKTKDGTFFFHVGFIDATPGKNGRPKYRAMRSTGVEARRGKGGGWTDASKKAAHRAAQAMIQKGRVFAVRDSMRHFLRDFWTPGKSEYLRSKAAEGRSVSPLYAESSRKLIENYFLPYFGNLRLSKLSDLDRRNLRAWRNTLYEQGNVKGVGKKIAPVTMNKVRQAVWTALQWAVDMEMLPYHPGTGVRRVYEQKSERPIFQLAELEKLFSVKWSDIRAYAACLLAAETGMRLGEVRGLKFQNLLLEQGYLDVVTNYVEGEGLRPPKWGSDRPGVPIPPVVAMAIREVIRVHRWGEAEHHYVLYNMYNECTPVTTAVINKGLREAIKAAKLPPAGRTFHTFRHSFVTHWRGSSHVLQRMVGHTNDTTTARYQHVSDEHREAMREYQSTIIPFPEAK